MSLFPHWVAACAVALVAGAPVPSAQAQTSVGPPVHATGPLGSALDRMLAGTQELAVFALGLIGIDYRMGGNTPESGFDCSGLVRYVFQQVTGLTLPRTARDMSRVGLAVDRTDLRTGDLVFFNTRRFAFSHVGIYLGDGRFIHAPSTGGTVEIVRLTENYWQKRFNGARRLATGIPDLVIPAAMAAANAPAPVDSGNAGGTAEAASVPVRPERDSPTP